MANEGSLGHPGLAELLRTIVEQHRTGLLELTGVPGAPDAQVAFLSARAVRYTVASRAPDPLGQLLVAAGVITPRQLRAALRVQRLSPNTVLGEVLVSQGAIDRATRDHFVALQMRERLFALLSLPAGRYTFSPRPPNFTKATFNPIPAELILKEGLRRVAEWPLIRSKIAGDDAVLRVVRRPEADESDAAALERVLDDAFAEVVEEPAGGKRVTAVERLVLDLLDGKRTVGEVARRSRRGDFETSKALYNLIQAGYLEAVRRGRTRPLRAESSGPGTGLRALLSVGLLGLLAAGAWWTLWGPGAAANSDPSPRSLVADLTAPLRPNHARALATALERYRLAHGAYPDTLDALVKEGLLSAARLTPVGGRPWDYVGVGQDYDLR
jgi:hypothetical protein